MASNPIGQAQGGHFAKQCENFKYSLVHTITAPVNKEGVIQRILLRV